MTVLLVTTPQARAALGPLLDAWSAEDRLVHIEPIRGRPPSADELTTLASGACATAVLVVGLRAYGPRSAVAGPVITLDDGRVIPVGWLPDAGAALVLRFAIASAEVHGRAGDRGSRETSRTIAVLGQRHRRFDDLANRVVRLVEEQRAAADPGAVVLASTRWTAYELHRDDLVAALALGPAIAVYVGHGRPIGWAGYAGTRAPHLGADAVATWRPGAVILSLTCKTASRYRTGLSFAEALPLQGVAAAALGAVRTTSHPANARWALRLTRAAADAATVGDLVAAVAPHDPAAAAYRLIGDPTAPLSDAPAMARHHELQEVH